MITATELTKTYKSGGGGTVVALNRVSFTLETGTFAAVVGPSGSGKSTLLSLLGGLDRPSSGELYVEGVDVAHASDRQLIDYRRHTIGFVFQGFNLIPNLTAIQNVELPMEFAGVPGSDRRARAIDLLNAVGLKGDTQLRRPSRLSGGEQQRVAIARALANRPALVLADEPTGNLDSKTGRSVIKLLAELSRSEGTTIVVVTHDRDVADVASVQFQLEDGAILSAVPSS